MSVLLNLRCLPDTYIKLKKNVSQQKLFIEKTLTEDMKSFLLTNDGSIHEKDAEKIKKYYGLGVPAVLGVSFALLRGTKITETERKAATYLGALTGIGDDFFDAEKYQAEDLRKLLNCLLYASDEGLRFTSLEKLFVFFYKKALQHTPNQEMLLEYTRELFKIQLLSLEQKQENINQERIKEITMLKGGTSLLFYRSVFEHPFDEAEKELLFNMGGLMQLANDIFDIYKDNIEQIKTLATTTNDIGELRRIFRSMMHHTCALAHNTRFEKKNIENYLRFISMGISRVYVCLDMLDALQKKNDNIFEASAFTRKQLICDMEKTLNILKSLRYYITYRI